MVPLFHVLNSTIQRRPVNNNTSRDVRVVGGAKCSVSEDTQPERLRILREQGGSMFGLRLGYLVAPVLPVLGRKSIECIGSCFPEMLDLERIQDFIVFGTLQNRGRYQSSASVRITRAARIAAGGMG